MTKTNLGRVMPIDRGEFSSTTTYAKLDLVHTADSTYISKVNNNTGHAVTDTNYWQCYADGKPATAAAATANAAAASANTAAAAAAAAAADVVTPAEVLAEHVARLEEEVKAIHESTDKLGDARARSLTLDTLLKVCGKDFYTEGAGAPTVAGACKFAEYYDTTNGVFYKYNGSAWKALN